jgi:putative zinc finger/helix-turn-helix YgiT family protein
MNENQVNFPSGERRRCNECGAGSVRLSFKDDHFIYGSGPDATDLTARVPVWTCNECGDAYTDGVAEDLRHEAVCRHLGVLNPSEVRAVREKYRMSQSEFAKATGFGLASVKRWETGALMQNQSADRLLRLLATDASIMDKLAAMDRRQITHRISRSVFRTQISAELRAEAAAFTLRPANV